MAPFEDTMTKHEWNGRRREKFAKMEINGGFGRSGDCKGIKKSDRLACTPCRKRRKALTDLELRSEYRPSTKRRRLLFSGSHLLTTPEKNEKSELLRKERKQLSEQARKGQRRTKRLELELSNYRPSDPEIRKAVKATKKFLEERREKLIQPKCKWILDNGQQCEHWGVNFTLINLRDHVFESHLRPQKVANALVEPYDRQYFCKWFGCRRKKPYSNFKTVVQHVMKEHVGDMEQLHSYKMMVNMAINSARQPSGRRYGAMSKTVCSANYRSQASWKRARALWNGTLPSVQTMLKIKNEGGVQSGIDYVTIWDYSRSTSERHDLRYGVLVFDEVR